MINFKALELSDKEYLKQFYSENTSKSCISCFGTMYAWNAIYPREFAVIGNTLIYKSARSDVMRFTFPIGGTDDDKISAVKEILNEYSDFSLKITNINENEKYLIEKNFVDIFEFSNNIDFSDYVYTKEKLEFLKGKKLHSKRNHINKFNSLYSGKFTVESINKDNIEECKNMSIEWCRANDCINSLDLQNEACAVKDFLENYFVLDLKGIVLRVDGKIIAFSFGEKLTGDTIVVHVEKALSEYDGAYAMINNLFVKNCCEGYEFINREEDTGDEGLRKAKLSYKPDLMIDKYSAVIKNKDL